MARSHSPGTAGSRSRLLCSRCLRGLSEQRPQKNCKAVLKKRKMRINSSLEFKFFSMEIIFDDFFTDVLSGCLFVHWEKKGGEKTEREATVFPKACHLHAQKHCGSGTLARVNPPHTQF